MTKEQVIRVIKNEYPNAYLQDQHSDDDLPMGYYLLTSVEYDRNPGIGKIYVWLKK